MKKKIPAALCAAILLLGLVLQAAAAGEDWDANVIFLGLNDSPMPLNDSTMPIRVGGTIYVPYTTFVANQNGGIKLGVFDGGQNKTQNTLALFNSDAKNLTFDLRTGVSYDYYPNGERKTPTAIIRNGQIYVSASSTCAYFGLECTQGNIVFGTKYYPYIRIHNADASLSDQQFRGSVTTPYLIQLQNYYRTVTAQTGGETGGESTPPSASLPTPAPDSRDERAVRVYLALRCDTGEAGEAVLDALAREGRAALLLFPADRLAQRDDLIRRAMGEGHVVGLFTQADTPAAAREELQAANELLAHIGRTSTRIVLAKDRSVADTLESEGWLCWQGNLSGLPEGRGSGTVYSELLRALEARENTARITLDDSATSAAVLGRLLTALREDRYDYHVAVETEF